MQATWGNRLCYRSLLIVCRDYQALQAHVRRQARWWGGPISTSGRIQQPQLLPAVQRPQASQCTPLQSMQGMCHRHGSSLPLHSQLRGHRQHEAFHPVYYLDDRQLHLCGRHGVIPGVSPLGSSTRGDDDGDECFRVEENIHCRCFGALLCACVVVNIGIPGCGVHSVSAWAKHVIIPAVAACIARSQLHRRHEAADTGIFPGHGWQSNGKHATRIWQQASIYVASPLLGCSTTGSH